MRANIHGPQQNRARITFAVFPLSAPPGAALRVHALIANRAHTRAFPAILRDVRKLRDWMVEQKGFELAAPMIGYARGIVPDFGAVSGLQKSTNTGRISSPKFASHF